MHLRPGVAKQPNLELKTQPKQILGSLPLLIALPGVGVLYACKDAHSLCAHPLHPSERERERGREREKEGERKREGGREREKERERKREGERERKKERGRERESEKELERNTHADHCVLTEWLGAHTLFTGQREKERERAGVLYACKGVHTLITGQREREREKERERERCRIWLLSYWILLLTMRALKGMTSALSPFSYLVIYVYPWVEVVVVEEQMSLIYHLRFGQAGKWSKDTNGQNSQHFEISLPIPLKTKCWGPQTIIPFFGVTLQKDFNTKSSFWKKQNWSWACSVKRFTVVINLVPQ